MSEYTTKGIGNAGLTTGIIGTALGVLNGGAGLLGMTGTMGGNRPEYVTKEELNMSMTIAAKDSEIAILKSEANANTKIIDTYKEIMSKVNANKDEQTAINATQAVYNAGNTAAVAVLNSQVAQLMGLTALRIPNTSVCPGWGEVTVKPVTQ